MAALPYIQFYVADYLADTMHLTTEEHGAYLLLIFNYWQTGKPIPKLHLLAITRISNERWPDVEFKLKNFFVDDGENWRHLRIDDDLSRVLSKSLKASAAGKASAARRKAKKEVSQAIENIKESNERSSCVGKTLQHNVNHTDTDTDTDIKKKIQKKEKPTKRFDDWYFLYPLKKSKAQAKSAWQKQSLDDRAEELIKILEKQILFDRQYQPDGCTPHPSTYLNNQRWEDDIETGARDSRKNESGIGPGEYDPNDTSWAKDIPA